MAPGSEGLGWGMGVGGPEAEVGEDLPDYRSLINEGMIRFGPRRCGQSINSTS